jgi:hypothetical protein
MTSSSNFWTRVLREKNLESPGREEAVREAVAYSREKKELKDSLKNKKK